MNKKQIIFLSVIFVLLIVGLAVKFLIRQTDTRVGQEIYVSLFPGLVPEKIEKVLISRPANTGEPRPALQAGRGSSTPVKILKKSDRWEIENLWGAKADEQKLSELFSAVRNARGELRGTDRVLFQDFGISDQEAISLRLEGAGNDPLLDLKIGTRPAGYDGFFVRKAGSPEVFFVETPLDRLLGIFMPVEEAEPSPDFWADLRLFNLDPEKIQRITISRLKNDTVLSVTGVERPEQEATLPGNEWRLIGPQQATPVDPGKVLRFITAMNSVRAQSVVDPEGEGYGLQHPMWRLIVTGADGGESILEAGPKNEKENIYFVKTEDARQVFRLKADFFEDLDIQNGQFLKEEPKAGPAGGVL